MSSVRRRTPEARMASRSNGPSPTMDIESASHRDKQPAAPKKAYDEPIDDPETRRKSRAKDVVYIQHRQARIKQLKKHFEKIAGEDGRITLREFRQALKSKNDFFTEKLFYMFDRRKDGRISLDEFISFLMDINSTEDKIDLLFNLYDLSGDGFLDRAEIETVIKAMVAESRLKLTAKEVGTLAASFYEQALQATREAGEAKNSITTSSNVSRDGFRRLLLKSETLSDDVSTLIDHWIGAVSDAKESASHREEEDKAIDFSTEAQSNPTFYSFLFGYGLVIILLMVTAGFLHRKAKDRNGDINVWLITARCVLKLYHVK